MTQIWERLYIGGFTDAERLARGNPNNIDTVISLCDAAEDKPKRSKLPRLDDEGSVQ